ncbi:calcineurin-binding protein cabin-1-like [Aphis gossypii]|uniref:calcineurin-binding protein cabin-1-like n=1 Tax=Aphis gossypii TaxID=80765 RepID=UPI002159535F|nr:calcineurin-binding protein cabin-1-like [Aphis gossypii]
MLPTKLRALNDCSTDESSNNDDVPVKITKEALETKAELQYSQALQCLARDQLDEAEEQLSSLLKKEIISSLNTTLNQKDKSQSLLAHLKYCCLTNLGNLLLKKSNYPEALIHYQEALKMDNTDLNLWYRIGFTHSKLYQTDQAISAFLEGIKCNPNHWPTLDKLITLLYASNEYVCCLYHISMSLNLDSGYLKGHFIKEIIFKKFPSLISYFKSYCSDGGLDITCTEIIDTNIQQKILDEIEDIKKNDPTLCLGKLSKSMECKPMLYAKSLEFKSWEQLGKWLLTIYDHMFENYEHSLLYEPIQFNHDSLTTDTTKHCIIVDEKFVEDDFEKLSFKLNVPVTKRRKSSPSLADQLKLSRRSARNKTNSKANESTLVKSIWNTMPQHLLLSNDGSNKCNPIKWSDDSMDTMDLYRLYEFSDAMSDGLTENLLKNNISEEERLKQINDENYFGSDHEAKDLINFVELHNNKSISDLLEIFLIIIANKWTNTWPSNMVHVYIDVFKRVWIHTEKQHITYISDSNFDSLDDEQIIQVKNEITSILTYGELLCDLYFQLKTIHKPLEGSIIGGDFCSLWIGSINDALSILDFKEDHMVINIRFLWLRALFNLQDKETRLTCDVLEMLLDFICDLDDYEIVLPNLEYFYRINKRIADKLIITLKRNNLLSTVKHLYESKEYLSVVNILKDTLKPQCAFMEIPSYQTMTRMNQYIFMLNSFLELKNYHELFKWCEPCLYEAILQHRKSLIEDCDPNQKTNQAEFINNIFYAMLESIKIEGLDVFDNVSQGSKSKLIQSVINLLSYLIETSDGNPEIDAVSPWLLIYNLLKHEESKSDNSFSSQTTNIPSSLSLLFLGHKYLGKRSWCCFEDGVLLFLTLSEIEPFIHTDLYNTSLVQQVDQIFYCLYTHLIKRNKPRHVQDHHSMGLALTWPRARQLMHFYQPQELPSYDGISKIFTINSDTEAMFKKVIALIPEDIKPNRLMDNLMMYIRGETDQLPKNDNPLPYDVKDIFYLMADFNFKNKTWSKAIRYYLLDLCNNLDRFDSWAAMALARGSQIETKLNSCESIKNEGDIIRRAHMTGRCYKHSLKISPENTTLLIEYGTFTYSIHSFCSRLLKQETSNMSLQMFGELEDEKEKMIKIARKCFETANNVWEYTDCDSQDERWMHHYVLGKITEKNDDNSLVFMDHYLKAAQYLDSYGAMFPEHIIYTSPQYYSIEVLEIYYRIHAGALKLLEKHDNQSSNEELLTKIKIALDQISDMSPIVDKKSNNVSTPKSVNCKDIIKKDINLTVKQTLNKIINHVMTSEKEIDNFKDGFQSEFITKTSNDNLNIPIKKMKTDSSIQDLIDFRWTLIQRCLRALEDCIKRFPQHYKSYYRLAHFYFRSPSHKDYNKFKDLMFGERGLFVGQRPHNFFHGVWRIPVSEIDRPGSFAYHMSRCIHLLLDFLKETGDHKMLLDLAIQLKYIPDLDKKYLRDNEREGISKEALFLSVQILRRMKSEYAKTNNRCKNELLLIQVFKSYKRVFKCWQQKDNTLSKLLLNVYQNIVGTKDDVSNDVIIKYCQKLQTKEKEIEYQSNIANNESDFTSPIANSKSTSILNSSQTLSTQMSIENQKRLYSPQVSHALPLNTQLSNQIMSMFAPYTQSPLMYPINQETSYNYTLQQKLQATKQKLKKPINKPKAETKRSTNSKTEKSDAHRLPNKPKKSTSIKTSIDSKIVRNPKLSINKPTKRPKINRLELSKTLNISHSTPNELKTSHNLDSILEINKLSNSISQSQNQKPNNLSSDKPKAVKHSMAATLVPMGKSKPTMMTKTTSSRNPKSVYIDLDSAAEQARLKSTILQNKNPETKKTATVPLSPAMLLSSCPGLSITPVVNTNDNRKPNETLLASHHVQNITTTSKNFNFEQLQHLGNSLTITKSEKNTNKKSKPELILID